MTICRKNSINDGAIPEQTKTLNAIRRPELVRGRQQITGPKRTGVLRGINDKNAENWTRRRVRLRIDEPGRNRDRVKTK